MEIDESYVASGASLQLDRVLGKVAKTGNPLDAELVGFVGSFNAAEVNAALDEILVNQADENRLINIIDWIIGKGENGLSPYKRCYLILRVVPKFLLPMILEKGAVSYRMVQCLKLLCEKHDYIVWDPFVKGLATALFAQPDVADGLLQLAKMLTTNYIALRSSEALVMLSFLLDSLDEGKDLKLVFQLLESLFQPLADADSEPHNIDHLYLELLLRNMLNASDELRASTTFGNVLHDFARSYGQRCFQVKFLGDMLVKCSRQYSGVLKDSLEALVQGLAI